MLCRVQAMAAFLMAEYLILLRNVYIWEATSGRLTYQLPGHKGSVNGIDFHPQEPIVLSCGSDKKIFLGELAL